MLEHLQEKDQSKLIYLLLTNVQKIYLDIQKEESKKICLELIESFRDIKGVNGVHLMGHKKEEVISEIIKESKK